MNQSGWVWCRCWSRYNLPPPPSTDVPLPPSPIYALLCFCLLSCKSLFLLEWCLGCVNWAVEWRKGEGSICLMVSCCPPSCYVFFHVFLVGILDLHSILMDTEEIGCQECTCRIHYNNNSLNMKRALLLYLCFCVCMYVNQEKSSTCFTGASYCTTVLKQIVLYISIEQQIVKTQA